MRRWLYLSLVSQPGTPVAFLGPLDLFNIPGGVLVVAPNLTVRRRLAALRPGAPGDLYDAFELEPPRFMIQVLHEGDRALLRGDYPTAEAIYRVYFHGPAYQVLERADVLTVHVPLNDETLGMIGASELARMPRHARKMPLFRPAARQPEPTRIGLGKPSTGTAPPSVESSRRPSAAFRQLPQTASRQPPRAVSPAPLPRIRPVWT